MNCNRPRPRRLGAWVPPVLAVAVITVAAPAKAESVHDAAKETEVPLSSTGGSNLEARNKDGWTIWDLATQNRHPAFPIPLREYLREQGQ